MAYDNEMDIFTALFTRRSIRRFVQGAISLDDIRMILKAGFHAPSAGNKRPVHFIVIRDRSILKALSKAKQEAEMIDEADAAIVICGDKNIQNYHDFLHEDCSAAIENMLLCIHGLNLGAVWCGVPSILSDCYQIYIDKLGLPENIVPVGTIAIGYPKEKGKIIDRFDEARVHFEHW